MKISAIVITLNEEQHLPRCLQSMKGVADEIIVVDSGSQDQTLQIAQSCGARVLTRAWTNYSDQKNFAASAATHDWILSLDADECLSHALRQELLSLKTRAEAAAAYEFPRRAFYLGQWISHSGWYPDYKIRLYRKQQARWDGAFVHERLVVQGPVSQVDADLLHYTCSSVTEHLRSLDRYTSLAAEELWSQGKRSGLGSLIVSPMSAFVKAFLLKSGFRDGLRGYLIAAFAAYYNFLKYAKLWELERRHSKASEPTGTGISSD